MALMQNKKYLVATFGLRSSSLESNDNAVSLFRANILTLYGFLAIVVYPYTALARMLPTMPKSVAKRRDGLPIRKIYKI